MSTLDELRRANIQAQKASVQTTPEPVKKTGPQPAAPVRETQPVLTAAPARETTPSAPVREAAPAAILETAKPSGAGDNGFLPLRDAPMIPAPPSGASEPPDTVVVEEIDFTSISTLEIVPADVPAAEFEDAKKLTAFLDRMRTGIAKKSVHPSGVKVTVDMAPELFWRLKRYSRDHGNPSLRQICLEVVIAFLDEEGY